MHFEASIEDAVCEFRASLTAREFACWMPEPARAPTSIISRHSDTAGWIWPSATKLGIIRSSTYWAIWRRFPSPTRTFDAAINIVTLEHVLHPDRVICELSRVLAPGGRFLLVAPLQWEEHQQPHDYGRFTRFALDRMLRQAGFTEISIQPVGGIFRLISRRLLNALQFFPGPLMFVAAIFFAPPALVLPLLDPLDKDRSFTLGYICSARKPS